MINFLTEVIKMSIQSVFKRYELKYLITREQKRKIIEALIPYMEMDEYGRTTIRNLYFDTDDYRIIRHSIEKPIFKEKLRIRSYEKANPEGKVFVELKRKYNSIVYKRRCLVGEKEAFDWITGNEKREDKSQITKEINYFLGHYNGLSPKVFLSYEREAFRMKDESDFRVTFDENILCREEELSLEKDVWRTPLLSDGEILMEIKCSSGIPIWMTNILSQQHIYKTSFSKYGMAYKNIIYPKLKEETKNVG